MRKILCSLTFLIFSHFLIAQPVNGRSYGSGFLDFFYSSSPTNDGNFILAGGKDDDAWVVKVDPNGNVIWETIYVPTNYADFDIIRQAPINGGYVVAGDGYYAKLDTLGNVEWDYQDVDLKCFDVMEKDDGGYFLVGYKNNNNQENAYRATLSSSGMVSSSTNSMTTYGNRFSSIHELPNGDYTISGTEYLSGGNSKGFIESRGGFFGNPLWFKYVGESIIESISTNDGGYLLLESDKIIKTNSTGDSLWAMTFAGTTLRSLIQTSDGGYALGGHNNSNNNGLFIKLDAMGNSLWSKNFQDLTGSIYIYSIIEKSNGEFTLTGSTSHNGNDGYFVTTDAQGNPLSIATLLDKQMNIQLFPNPTTEMVTITLDQMPRSPVRAELIDLTGNVIKVISIEDKSTSFSMEDFPSAIYVLNVEGTKNTYKIVKQ